jgi:hypothetical protein
MTAVATPSAMANVPTNWSIQDPQGPSVGQPATRGPLARRSTTSLDGRIQPRRSADLLLWRIVFVARWSFGWGSFNRGPREALGETTDVPLQIWICGCVERAPISRR